MIFVINVIFMIGSENYHYKKVIERSHVIINHALKECGLKIYTGSVQLLEHIRRIRGVILVPVNHGMYFISIA